MEILEQIEKEEKEAFRDSIGTIDEKGKRVWIYPRLPQGRLYDYRKLLSYFYLLVFFGLPFIKVEGEPLFLINVIERKFILFGKIFWPQDFIIFGIGMITFMVFIALFTVVFGRVFCGWACPQTIFMEMVFRRIENWIEGDATQQRKLSQSKWNKNKILKRGGKWLVFWLVSFLIANTFLSYIIGADEVLKMATEPIAQHKGTLIGISIFTTVFFFVYSWFREQVCLIVCPYGRMQGVLLDKDSVVVAYDYVRGEPRHKFHKHEERSKGDCVDCGLCVRVCPTGIDIRNGTQLECVNCTACIDACDKIMDSVGMEKGLIRYASENGIAQNKKLRWTTRMKAYTAVLFLLIGVEVFLLTTRTDVDATVLRASGMLFQEQPNNQISNLYNIKVINKTRKDIPLNLKIENFNGTIQVVGNDMIVKREDVLQGTFFVYLNKSELKKRKTKLEIGLYVNNKKIKTIKTNFLGPIM